MNKNNPNDIIQQFRVASRKYSDASIFMHEAIARKAGLTGSDHKYLGLILQHDQLTAGDISKLTGLTGGAVTGLIDRLEKKKLLKRQFTKDDRRKVIIIPNMENSMKLLQPIFSELQRKTTDLLATFSEKEIQIIKRYFTEATVIMNETTNNLNNK
ncbi:TPA: MarR family transcriptional regulator [Elizabethkingia anophelis]|nr:MarR family transcriptional regulator [Elizabethkingia anophelis]HBN6707295.1 MarR family transcriptional regulator [Elizabethkingia anophelis]HBN6711329.1 MarR family transcriptional regulator [Elizabethkingia anophelis]HBN6714115.1 MarR family transcriptional regulator [Elizabethkingia anophelis]HBN6719653.1 MarR family transcriptional regulator [Elizabethkingia anophelis]